MFRRARCTDRPLVGRRSLVQRLAGRLQKARWDEDMLQRDVRARRPDAPHASCRMCAEGLTSAFRYGQGCFISSPPVRSSESDTLQYALIVSHDGRPTTSPTIVKRMSEP